MHEKKKRCLGCFLGAVGVTCISNTLAGNLVGGSNPKGIPKSQHNFPSEKIHPIYQLANPKLNPQLTQSSSLQPQSLLIDKRLWIIRKTPLKIQISLLNIWNLWYFGEKNC